MLSELMTAEEAYRTGIVARVVADAELQAKAEAMAEQLSKGPTRAHEATKLVISTWSTSGVRAADEVMIGAVVDLLDTRDCRARRCRDRGPRRWSAPPRYRLYG